MAENIRTASAKHFDALWSGNTLKRRPRHCTLDFHTKVQVWGGNRIASRFKFQPSKGVSLFQEGVSPGLLKKKKKIEREKTKKKGRRKDWKRAGNLHIKLHPAKAPHTQATHAHEQSRKCSTPIPGLCCSIQHAIAIATPRYPSYMLTVSILG